MIVCTRCKVERNEDLFKGPKKLKNTCSLCRETSKKLRELKKLGILPSRDVFRNRRLEALKKENFICSKCDKELPISKFKKIPESSFGLSSNCLDCRNLVYKYCKLKTRYGISKESYNDLYRKQEGQCDICATSIKFTSNNSDLNAIGRLDHCHKTGKIRGLLCNDYNRALGFFKDDENLLFNAYKYLVAHLKSGELMEKPEEVNHEPSTELNAL